MTLLQPAGFQLQLRSEPPGSHRQDRLPVRHTCTLHLSFCGHTPMFLKYSVTEVTYPNFWYHSTKCFSWILSDETWEVTDDTDPLHLLTNTEEPRGDSGDAELT